MLPPAVLSAMRQGKFLGSEQKYSDRTQKYTTKRFDNGPFLFVPTSVVDPPTSIVEFVTCAMGRGQFAANADAVMAAGALTAYTAAVDTAAGTCVNSSHNPGHVFKVDWRKTTFGSSI